MPYITTAVQIIKAGDLPAYITEDLLEPHRPAAQSRLISWVGQEAYNDALKETPAEPTRTAILIQAENLLVLYYAIPTIGIKIGTNSGLIRRTLTEVTGTSVDETWFADPRHLDQIRNVWLDDAARMCDQYRIAARPALFGGQAKSAT